MDARVQESPSHCETSRGYWKRLPVCVLGGTGFLGSHLIERLLGSGARVRDLSLPARVRHATHHDGPDYRLGDVRNSDDVKAAVAGAKVVFLTAGPVVFGSMSRTILQAHRDGVRRVIDALHHDVRLVYTSSVVAIGATRTGEVLDESACFNLDRLRVGYVQAKRVAEEEALAAAAGGRDIVVVNPGYLFGPGDPGPSIMGHFCLRVWRGNIPFALPGGLNAVDVRDVAEGHLLAAERGTAGRRYILVGENLTYQALAVKLAEAAERRYRFAPRLPTWAFTALAAFSEGYSRFSSKPPFPSFENARLNRLNWFYSFKRANRELGFSPRPLAQTLADAFQWHATHGRVVPRGLNRWLFPPV